jgi:hypothetical protein
MIKSIWCAPPSRHGRLVIISHTIYERWPVHACHRSITDSRSKRSPRQVAGAGARLELANLLLHIITRRDLFLDPSEWLT